MEFLLVSFNGRTDNPLGDLEEQPEGEYNAALAEVNKIRVPFKPEK